MDKKYGQAEYMIGIMDRIIGRLLESGLVTEKQARRISELNKQSVFGNYPSADDLEVAA